MLLVQTGTKYVESVVESKMIVTDTAVKLNTAKPWSDQIIPWTCLKFDEEIIASWTVLSKSVALLM